MSRTSARRRMRFASTHAPIAFVRDTGRMMNTAPMPTE
jgi:hypothetical protein